MLTKFFTVFFLFQLLASCSSNKIKEYPPLTPKELVLDDPFQSLEEVAEDDSSNLISKTPISESSFIYDQQFKGNKITKSFNSAKSILNKLKYFGIRNELYCGCEFDNGTIPTNAACGIKARKNEKRALKIEFEHIVPFENQVGHTKVWDEGVVDCKGKKGRDCASKIFKHLEADLWNLWPAGGEMNGDRSNYSYAVVQGPRNQYGKCDFIVKDRKAEPRDEVKALIAYTYLYFQKTYAKFMNKNYITNENKKMFSEWTKLPVTSEQCNWAKEVLALQGNRNDYLLKACKIDK